MIYILLVLYFHYIKYLRIDLLDISLVLVIATHKNRIAPIRKAMTTGKFRNNLFSCTKKLIILLFKIRLLNSVCS